MTRKRVPDEVEEQFHLLHPDHFYRLCEGPRFFGYGPAWLDRLIKSGEIPTPVALSEKGRARGWFGRTIIEWQQARKPAPKPIAKSVRKANAGAAS